MKQLGFIYMHINFSAEASCIFLGLCPQYYSASCTSLTSCSYWATEEIHHHHSKTYPSSMTQFTSYPDWLSSEPTLDSLPASWSASTPPAAVSWGRVGGAWSDFPAASCSSSWSDLQSCDALAYLSHGRRLSGEYGLGLGLFGWASCASSRTLLVRRADCFTSLQLSCEILWAYWKWRGPLSSTHPDSPPAQVCC